MSQPVLYLMVGYPGSGKTTTAKAIHEMTGAVHLWADKIRRERFGEPTYSHEENIELYNHMNELTAELLRSGNSVIFDTNFNFKKDRAHLKHIAEEHKAKTTLLWLQTPEDTSRERATRSTERSHTRILGDELGNMPLAEFNRIAANLEVPSEAEQPIKIDGTNLNREELRNTLQAHQLI